MWNLFFVPYDPNNEKFISIFCFSSPINPFHICSLTFLLVDCALAVLSSAASSSTDYAEWMSADLWFSVTRKNRTSLFRFRFYYFYGIYLIYYWVQLRLSCIYVLSRSSTRPLPQQPSWFNFIRMYHIAVINFSNENLLSNEKRVQCAKIKVWNIHFFLLLLSNK